MNERLRIVAELAIYALGLSGPDTSSPDDASKTLRSDTLHALLRSALALHQFSLLEPNQTENLDTISRANDALNIGLYNAMASDWAALYQPGSSIQLYHDEAPPRGEFFQRFSYSYFLGIGDIVDRLPVQSSNEEVEELVKATEKHIFHLLELHPARDQFAKQLSTPLNPVTPEAWQALAHTGIIPFFEEDDARPRSEVERPHPTGSNWEFWREWYQSFIDGQPMDQELLRRIAFSLDDNERSSFEYFGQRVERIRAQLKVETTLSDVRNSFGEISRKRHGIGGNNPPPDKQIAQSLTLIWEATEELSSAVAEERPAREWVEANLNKLKEGLAGLLKWGAKTSIWAASGAFVFGTSKFATAVADAYIAKHPEKIEAVIKAIEEWLPFLS